LADGKRDTHLQLFLFLKRKGLEMGEACVSSVLCGLEMFAFVSHVVLFIMMT